MLRFKVSRRSALAVATALPFGLAALGALAVNPDTTTLPNGAELSVEIFNPLQDEEFKVPATAGPGGTIDVPVDGEASIGEGLPAISLIYVVDVSGSTDNEACGDGVILDCEIDAVKNVDADPNMSSVNEVGIAVFADDGAAADMSGDPGDQLLIDPNAAPNNRVETVIDSAFSQFGGNGGLTEFSPRNVGVGTDFSRALEATTSILATATPTNTKRVLFLSDGGASQASAPGGFAGQLAALAATGAIADTVAVGALAGCDRVEVDPAFGTLQEISDATGGTCFELPEPADLPDFLPNLLFTSLNSVQVAVSGIGNVPTNTVPSVPVDGPITVMYDALPNLGVGDYNVTATAEGEDSSAPPDNVATVVADVDIHLLQLTAGPPNEINELSADNAHTVNGQILGGTGPDRDIDFQVGGQNASTATPGNGSSLATPGGAQVSFNYTVPVACPSLGQDTITVSTTIGGMLDEIVLTKDWVDTIAPQATCEPAVNPHGKKKPSAPGRGGQGQNQDGFYELLADDNLVDGCEPLVINVMDADGFVFGPFSVGAVIKYTQDDGAPQEEKKMGSTGGGNNGKSDAVTAHLKGHGDLTISATDGAGNTGPEVTCLVPPPPK